MPGLPPNARREKLSDYKNQFNGIIWKEEKTKAEDGTEISLCVASVSTAPSFQVEPLRIYILYFQGNASSIPPRLPFLSPVLRLLQDRSSDNPPVIYTMICCSYRGYWTSKGRPSEKGIALDAAASLQWIATHHTTLSPSAEIPMIIWGQSIGAGVATTLSSQQNLFINGLSLQTLIVETPFLSIRSMLETLYPQKWLPYRYLWPFLWNHLDSWEALGVLKDKAEKSGVQTPEILIVEAGRDELVPREHGEMLEKRCRDLGMQVSRKVVHGALHTEVLVRPEGRAAVVNAIRKVSKDISMK